MPKLSVPADDPGVGKRHLIHREDDQLCQLGVDADRFDHRVLHPGGRNVNDPELPGCTPQATGSGRATVAGFMPMRLSSSLLVP